jgi:hypothetical protein
MKRKKLDNGRLLPGKAILVLGIIKIFFQSVK